MASKTRYSAKKRLLLALTVFLAIPVIAALDNAHRTGWNVTKHRISVLLWEKTGFKIWDIFIIRRKDLGEAGKSGGGILYVTMDCRSEPKGTSGAEPSMRIAAVSDDKDCGRKENLFEEGLRFPLSADDQRRWQGDVRSG